MPDNAPADKANIFGDLSAVETSLSGDIGAEKARAMIEYFDDVRKSSEALLQQPLSETDRHLVKQLIEGFQAAQRIIRHVWEKLHATAFPA